MCEDCKDVEKNAEEKEAELKAEIRELQGKIDDAVYILQGRR